MRHSWFVPILVAIAVLSGYAAGARPVQAQPETLPFQLGATVEIGFDASHSRRCQVEEMRGTFMRCRNLSRSDRANRWINLAQAAWVTTGTLGTNDATERR